MPPRIRSGGRERATEDARKHTARKRHGWAAAAANELRLPCGICCQRPNEEITFHECERRRPTTNPPDPRSDPGPRGGSPPPPSSAASARAFFLTSSHLQNAPFPHRTLATPSSGAAQSLGTTTHAPVRRERRPPVQAVGTCSQLFTAPDASPERPKCPGGHMKGATSFPRDLSDGSLHSRSPWQI